MLIHLIENLSVPIQPSFMFHAHASILIRFTVKIWHSTMNVARDRHMITVIINLLELQCPDEIIRLHQYIMTVVVIIQVQNKIDRKLKSLGYCQNVFLIIGQIRPDFNYWYVITRWTSEPLISLYRLIILIWRQRVMFLIDTIIDYMIYIWLIILNISVI